MKAAKTLSKQHALQPKHTYYKNVASEVGTRNIEKFHHTALHSLFVSSMPSTDRPQLNDMFRDNCLWAIRYFMVCYESDHNMMTTDITNNMCSVPSCLDNNVS